MMSVVAFFVGLALGYAVGWIEKRYLRRRKQPRTSPVIIEKLEVLECLGDTPAFQKCRIQITLSDTSSRVVQGNRLEWRYEDTGEEVSPFSALEGRLTEVFAVYKFKKDL